jgi:hypothetical protein
MEQKWKLKNAQEIRVNQNPLKGPWHEIFDLWFFSSNNSPSDRQVKAFLNMASNLQRKSTKLVPHWREWHRCVLNTSLCMSQRCQWYHCASHISVNDTAVHPTLTKIFANDMKHWNLYRLHINNAVTWTAVPMTLLCKYDTAVTFLVTAVSLTSLCTKL